MENAIIMASGMGTRLRPLTQTVPKPLLKVQNTPMIETVLQGLLKRDVHEIFIVVGYLSEQFYYLKQKYSNVTIIQNEVYETVNNISSVYYARDILDAGNCFICEADLYIPDSSIFDVQLDCSCYFGTFVNGYSDDWVFEQNENGRIVRVGKGGVDCYNMVGISYFKADDAKILKRAIEKSYGKKGYETLFWDDVVNDNLDKINLSVYPIGKNKIIEIDTVNEFNTVNAHFKS